MSGTPEAQLKQLPQKARGPHQHDPDVRQRRHDVMRASHPAQALNASPHEATGRVEKYIVALPQRVDAKFDRTLHRHRAALLWFGQGRYSQSAEKLRHRPHDRRIDTVFCRHCADAKRPMKVGNENDWIDQGRVVRQEQNAARAKLTHSHNPVDADAIAQGENLFCRCSHESCEP